MRSAGGIPLAPGVPSRIVTFSSAAGRLAERERTEDDVVIEREPVEVGGPDGRPGVVDHRQLGVQVDRGDPGSWVGRVVGPAGEDADLVGRRGADLLDQAGLSAWIEQVGRMLSMKISSRPGLSFRTLARASAMIASVKYWFSR